MALPALGRLRNGGTQIRASTFYKMVHYVSDILALLHEHAASSFASIDIGDVAAFWCSVAHTSPQHRLKQTLWDLQQQLDAPVFTIWVSANYSQPVTGELTFGGVNARYYTGSLVTLPVNSQVCCHKPSLSH